MTSFQGSPTLGLINLWSWRLVKNTSAEFKLIQGIYLSIQFVFRLSWEQYQAHSIHSAVKTSSFGMKQCSKAYSIALDVMPYYFLSKRLRYLSALNTLVKYVIQAIARYSVKRNLSESSYFTRTRLTITVSK